MLLLFSFYIYDCPSLGNLARFSLTIELFNGNRLGSIAIVAIAARARRR
jgi:hypothetical protein